MLELLLRPLRSALGVTEREVERPLAGSEHEIAAAVAAVHRAADSIEHHVEVVEGLATAVGPLTDSVNQLTATMADLTALLAPLASAERDVEEVRRLFGFRRRAAPQAPKPDASQ